MPRDARKESPKGTATKKLPSWHLTGNKTMLYVKEANTRSQKKKEKVEKENKVKKRLWKSTGWQKEEATKNENNSEVLPTGLHTKKLPA